MTTEGQYHFEFAGMTDEWGRLGNAVLAPTTSLTPLRYVELEGERLYYLWSLPFPVPGPTNPPLVEPEGMLDAFLRIRDGRDVLRFARRYGVLRICEHGLPWAHRRVAPRLYPTLPVGQGYFGPAGQDVSRKWEPIALCKPLGYDQDLQWDPIRRWLDYVSQAQAILRIAAKLHREEPTSLEDWGALEGVPGLFPGGLADYWWELMRWDPSFERMALAHAVDDWLRDGGVQPSLDWLGGEPRIVLEPDLFVGGWTFGMLAVQLMTAVSRAHAVALCSGCGTTYLRSNRAPQGGKRNFCPVCRGTVAGRMRKRHQRARTRRTDRPTGH